MNRAFSRDLFDMRTP